MGKYQDKMWMLLWFSRCWQKGVLNLHLIRDQIYIYFVNTWSMQIISFCFFCPFWLIAHKVRQNFIYCPILLTFSFKFGLALSSLVRVDSLKFSSSSSSSSSLSSSHHFLLHLSVRHIFQQVHDPKSHSFSKTIYCCHLWVCEKSFPEKEKRKKQILYPRQKSTLPLPQG